MPKKKIDFKKRHNSAFFKYSNQELFERREKEFFKNSIDKKGHKNIYSYTSRNRYRNIKQNFLKEKNIFQYLKTLQFLNSSEKSSKNTFLKTISYNDENDLTPRNKITHTNKFKSKSKKNIFILTENNYMKPKIYTSNNSSKNYYKINYYNKLSIDKKTLIKNRNKKTITNKYNYKDIKKLLLIQKEKKISDMKNDEEIKKEDKIKDLKLFQFHCYKGDFKDYIKKLGLYKLTNISTEAKKERAIRLEEIYNNQIEFYKHTYNSLLKSKKLFDKKFIIKISEYLKYLSIKIDKEKLENSELKNKILDLENEIESINTKIKKVESEKSNIVRWLYLQIQVKEKKLILPDYYKVVFEYNNISTKKYKQKTIKKQVNFSKKDNLKTSENEKNNEINKNNNNFIDINGIRINFDEYERLNNYKIHLIYKTPEIFNEALLSLENNNLKLINYYDNIRNILFFLKKEFKKVKKEENDIDNYINNKINENKNEINSLKSTILSGINFSIDSKLNSYKKEKKINKKSILFIKVHNIYMNLIESNNEKNYKNNLINNKKITEEQEIINMLRFIEIKTDELIHNIYSNSKYEDNISIQKFISKIKYEIEKEHKNEKAYLQKIKQMEKHLKLYEKIEARNNKIYFLPKKKLDISTMRPQRKIKYQKKSC